MRHAFAARSKVIDEIEDFADAWIERHRKANAEVISECAKAPNGAGQAMGVFNTWAMNSARVMAEDMSSAMNFWMNCARHCMSEAQPAFEESAQEARDRIVSLASKTD